MAETPKIKEGYILDFYHVRWRPYKPDGKRQMKRAGRWQRMNDYGGYENCDAPGRLLQEPVDLEQMLAAPGLYAALEDACTSLMIVSEQALDASKTDARWLGVYEKLQPHIKAGRSALSKARGETNG